MGIPRHAAAFKAPLKKSGELANIFPGTPSRTITDQAVNKRIPAIQIGTDWRFRVISLERWQDNV